MLANQAMGFIDRLEENSQLIDMDIFAIKTNLLTGAPIYIAIVVAFLVLLAIHPYVVAFAYLFLCLWALLGPKHAIQALSLNYIIVLFNPAIYALPEGIGVLRWTILFFAGLRVLPFTAKRSLRYLIPLFFFFLMITVLSWTVSPQFQISFLKIAIFTYFAATVLTAFDSLDNSQLHEVKIWFFCLTATVVILSIPTLLFHNIGYLRNGRGFQGILNHPQAFGTFMAPITAYIGALLLFNANKNSYWKWLFGVTSIVIICISQARTAMLTFLLSLAITFAIIVFCSRQRVFEWAPYRRKLP